MWFFSLCGKGQLKIQFNYQCFIHIVKKKMSLTPHLFFKNNYEIHVPFLHVIVVFENLNSIWALSIAYRFIVVRLLLPVHQITAPYEQKYTYFKLVKESVSGFMHIVPRAIVNLRCGAYVDHDRICHAMMRKYRA